MFMQMGLAFMVIWAGNFVWMIYQVVKHTPNWRDEDVTSDDILNNFMMNATLEQIEMLRKVAQINPMMGMGGVTLLLMSLII